MSKEKALVPELRFPEFEGEWTIEKLAKVAKVFDGTHQTPKYVAKGIPFASVENIANPLGTEKFITSEAFTKDFKNGRAPQIGDILMTRITAGVIGATSIVTSNSPLAYYVSLALIRPSELLLPEFLSSQIIAVRFRRELHKRIIHVAFPKKINLGDIGDCPVYIPPSTPEQQKIAAFLDAVSKKTTLLTQKREALTDYKRGLMQRLFSGALRFTRPDGSAFPDWEDKPLSSHLTERKEYQTKSGGLEHISLTVKGVVPKSERYDRDFLVSDDTTKKYRVTRLGDLCYNPANLKFGVIAMNKYGDGIFSPIYVTFEVQGINLGFLEAYITSWDFLRIVRRYEQGTVYERQGVSSSDFLKARVPLPHPEEQTKIADALSALDAKIDAISTQISQMETFKKGLLQKMFV